MKVAIIGQQDFGKAVLEKLLARGDDITAVFCAPEKEGARPDALRVAAQEKGLTVHQFKSLKAPEAVEAMKAAGIISHAALADPNSMASKSGLKMWQDMLQGTPAFFVIAGADNTRATQIAAGRAYARAQLTATSLGLSMHPWSMALQEFPEMAEPYRATQAELGGTPMRPSRC